MSDEPWRWSASALVNAIQDKTLSSREVVQAHLDRMDAINGAVNAVTAVLAEEALAAADRADRRVASGDPVGPLHGLPITVKENIDVEGSATTQGVVSLRHSIAERDAPVIRHLKAAGAIVVARTNMPDFGLRWHTDNDLHGATMNPWDPSRTPGGSSGGEAAAIATGMSPLGIGNDMGGSVRQPAVNCSIAGHRPTTGRVSRVMSTIFEAPPLFYDQVTCVNGPMARHVGDLRLALKVMARPDLSDPIWTLGAAPPVAAANDRCVGLGEDPSGDGVAPGVAEALSRAADILEDAGFTIEPIDPPLLAEADEVIQRLAETDFAKYMEDILPIISANAASVLQSVLHGTAPDAATYRDAIAARYRIAAAWSRLMHRFPLILGPVSTMEAFAVDYDIGGVAAMRRLIRSFRLTELCNLLGLPSLALPVSFDDGLPQGVQIIARRFDEDRCFAAAEVIERAVPTPTPIDPVIAGPMHR